MYRLNCCVAVAVAGLGGQAAAGIINVPSDELTIQAGIDAAVNGDEVVVAPGTYNENIDFSGKAITLRSSSGRDVTTIDGGLSGRVVTLTSGLGRDTVLEGFTIRNGFALNSNGGGIYIQNNSSPIVRNCRVVGNKATNNGGGIYASSSALIIDCLIEGNLASQGGGIYLTGVTELTNCIVSGNAAFTSGGGVYAQGGLVENCVIRFNQAQDSGSGIGCTFIEISNSTLCSNWRDGIVESQLSGPFADGGGNVIADECTPPSCEPDLDGDGVVAVPDLLTLLSAWGPCQ